MLMFLQKTTSRDDQQSQLAQLIFSQMYGKRSFSALTCLNA